MSLRGVFCRSNLLIFRGSRLLRWKALAMTAFSWFFRQLRFGTESLGFYLTFGLWILRLGLSKKSIFIMCHARMLLQAVAD